MKRHNNYFYIIVSVLVCFGFAAAYPPQNASAYNQVPYSVRVGLYYGASGNDGAGAASSYQVYCEDGLSLGCTDGGGGYRHLYDFTLPDASQKMGLSKYAFAKSFAVVTGRQDATVYEVAGRVSELRQKGYDPQLAYLNGWVLIVDFFDTQNAAASAIENGLSDVFPGFAFNAEALSGKYILITVGNTRQFIFDASYSNLRAVPIIREGNETPALIELDGARYRGDIELIRGVNNDMAVVNIIAMDDYLYGVVPNEIQASSSYEAIKAQAVAARTYAVNSIGKHGDYGFDLCTGAHCQVYNGYASENARSSGAVDETSGKIVTYQGAPASVFYFSSSGGYTANVKHVWNDVREYPYLIGVEDSYESGLSYRYNWETIYTAGEIKAKLAANGINIGDITGVVVTGTSDGGRAIEVTISGTLGKKVFSNGDCRTFINNLHSQMYTVFATNANDSGGAGGGGNALTAIGADGAAASFSGAGLAIDADGQLSKLIGNGGSAVSDNGYSNISAKGAVFHFVGRGWGHGVGMSQEGAKGMADAGFTYIEILTHYFPGCAVG